MNVAQDFKFVDKISIVSLLIGLAGFFVSLYALIIHIQGLLKPGGSTFCDVSATISCSQVIGSSYGEFASIPLGSYGMAYFAIIIALAVLPKIAQVTKKWLAFWEVIVSVVGMVCVVALMFISYFILHMLCPTCSVVQVLTICYCILKIAAFIKVRKEAFFAVEGAFSRFFALALCLAIPPLAAGLIAPLILLKLF